MSPQKGDHPSASAPDEGRVARMAENEAVFRSVNQAIVRVVAGPRSDKRHEFTCECSRAECTSQVSMTLDEYQAVRENPIRFFVVPGHAMEEIERVVDTNDRYEVVEKTEPPPPEIARETAG